MSRSLSWIDPEALSVVLVRAGVRREPRDRPRPVHVDLWRLEPEPLVARLPAPVSAAERAVAGPARAPAEESFHAPDGTLQARLSAYIAWVVRVTGCRRLWVVDAEGLVLTERAADSELIAVSSSFMGLLERVRSALGSEIRGVVTIDLDEERILHLVQAETGLGRFTLGLVSATPVRRSLVDGLKSGLAAVLQAEVAEAL